MSLRSRLLVALLVLALVPTLVFTLFTLDQLDRATDRWYRPGVNHALESALEISRTSLTRLEATALDRADAWAATPLPLDAAKRDLLRDELRKAGLDFTHVYARDARGWHQVDIVAPSGVLAADSLDFSAELEAALAGTRLIHSAQGVLAAAARAGPTSAIVTGVRLTPDYWTRLQQVAQARELYGRLGVLVDVQRRYVWLLVLALVTLISVAAVFAARELSREMMRPLGALSQGFERVAAGELDARVPEQGASELRRLAASFNTMTARLAEARVALAGAEREAAWREVARHLAHEIRNPLTPMRLSLHRLQRRVDLVPQDQRAAVRDSLAALLQEVEHLTQMAEQFAQYARLPEPRFEPLDLAEIVRASSALHEPENLTIRVDAAGPLPVRGDRLLLSRALHNLLLNACEASAPGGALELHAGRDGDEIWVEVRDRGSGLPDALGERAFEPYVSTKNRGSGLGLSLVRDVATRHGGSVTLANRDGGGACARLVLPLDRPGETDDRA